MLQQHSAQNDVRFKEGCRDGVTCVVYVLYVFACILPFLNLFGVVFGTDIPTFFTLVYHCHPYTKHLWFWHR